MNTITSKMNWPLYDFSLITLWWILTICCYTCFYIVWIPEKNCRKLQFCDLNSKLIDTLAWNQWFVWIFWDQLWKPQQLIFLFLNFFHIFKVLKTKKKPYCQQFNYFPRTKQSVNNQHLNVIYQEKFDVHSENLNPIIHRRTDDGEITQSVLICSLIQDPVTDKYFATISEMYKF